MLLDSSAGTHHGLGDVTELMTGRYGELGQDDGGSAGVALTRCVCESRDMSAEEESEQW